MGGRFLERVVSAGVEDGRKEWKGGRRGLPWFQSKPWDERTQVICGWRVVVSEDFLTLGVGLSLVRRVGE